MSAATAGPPGPDFDRAGLFLPDHWAAAPWIAPLVGARAVVPRPTDDDGGRLDAVVAFDTLPFIDRAMDFARRWRLPIRWVGNLTGPIAPPRLGIAPIALRCSTSGRDPQLLHDDVRHWLHEPDAAERRRAARLLDLVLTERVLAPEAGGIGLGLADGDRRPILIDAVDAWSRGQAGDWLDMALGERSASEIGVVVDPAFPRTGTVAGSVVETARALGVAVIADDGRADLFDGVEAFVGEFGWTSTEAALRGIPRLVELSLNVRAEPDAPVRHIVGRFLHGARYVDPFTLEPLSPEAGIALIAELRRRYAARRDNIVGLGFSAQKARTATTFLAGWANEVAFETRRWAVPVAAREGARLVAWGARGGSELEAEAAAAGVPVSRLEDGFVRSVGLGTQQTIPASLALDDLGLYYDARRPSRLERLCRETDFPPELVARARRLRERLVATRVTKYNLPAERLDFSQAARGRRVVLVIGQVPDDAAIRYGTAGVTGNLALLAAVRRDRPDAFVVYKEHPDLVTRSRAGWLGERRVRAHADLALRRGDAIAAIEAADEVHVLSSLAGFEALLRAKPVVAWGIPFYAGWGLTEDRAAIPRRGRVLALDELVAAALILYPSYVDPVSRLPCEVEDVIGRIEAIRAGRAAAPPATRFRRLVRASVVAEAWLRHCLDHAWRPR